MLEIGIPRRDPYQQNLLGCYVGHSDGGIQQNEEVLAVWVVIRAGGD